MTPAMFCIFPGCFARELFNTWRSLDLPGRSLDLPGRSLDLPGRSRDVRALRVSSGDIGRVGMYVVIFNLFGKPRHYAQVLISDLGLNKVQHDINIHESN